MKLVQLNNSYSNPITGEAFKDTFITDGVSADDFDSKELKISFRLKQKIIEKQITPTEGGFEEKDVEVIKKLAETTLVFDGSDTPTYITIDGETKDLFAYLGNGGKLKGDELIEVGYPNYNSAQKYFTDKIGEPVDINPELDEMGQLLVKTFILQKVIINGEPIGKQFKF
ncbi:hypothetical protein FORMB_16760 [Formosa sp. Hel1_33_131]|uniref:hypothetical protein n=1 Tax=Formosa sp. Hel1_33_131 TaxID=1336794 RepID=UPI00084E15FF|nr:hypothetical protein [Formosa sp. Hel1_33_131]AOR28715.1 hypothetical protein FORMB_16760 [Formosa sp. Hel1_33_131]